MVAIGWFQILTGKPTNRSRSKQDSDALTVHLLKRSGKARRTGPVPRRRFPLARIRRAYRGCQYGRGATGIESSISTIPVLARAITISATVDVFSALNAPADKLDSPL